MDQQKLQKTLKRHQWWLDNVANGARANLIGADLRGANLSKAYLSGANLSEADLSGATGLLDPVQWLASLV